MEENITGDTIVRKNETVALGYVEPFDCTGDFDKVGTFATAVTLQGALKASVPPRKRGLFPHKNAPFFQHNRN
ncbi:hypothetical protein [Mesorhizobium sp.]|uniref:hypothetical protein n=1 Tax=Mesorhizobium sp. TaxID=1871066 RepID=UPI0025C04F07|nr:hypothetical protein [Mesorhizobium sp.]